MGFQMRGGAAPAVGCGPLTVTSLSESPPAAATATGPGRLRVRASTRRKFEASSQAASEFHSVASPGKTHGLVTLLQVSRAHTAAGPRRRPGGPGPGPGGDPQARVILGLRLDDRNLVEQFSSGSRPGPGGGARAWARTSAAVTVLRYASARPGRPGAAATAPATQSQ